MKPRYRVIITEHDRWNGPSELDRRYFTKKEMAERFVREYNAQNNLKEVPDWYATAGTPVLVDLNEEENG